jgi:hypothetical protein
MKHGTVYLNTEERMILCFALEDRCLRNDREPTEVEKKLVKKLTYAYRLGEEGYLIPIDHQTGEDLKTKFEREDQEGSSEK